jgi:2-polyprenyl-3-methyl-5-hydroxy-6-metoxy-1,4-benzoquinol methylase
MADVNPVGVTLQNRSSFDATAMEYDAHFTQHCLGRWLREAVHRHVAALVQPDSQVLELGCGTGEDAVWLAQRGAWVTATDASSAMLEITAHKAAAAGVADRISTAQLDLSNVGDWISRIADPDALASNPQYPIPNTQYDAVLANFGVLNCLPDRRALAAALAQWVKPGGHVALVVMSPLCPWEIAWYMGHGQIRTAFRRFRSGGKAHLGNGASVRVWYPSPRRLRIEFAPYFRPMHTAGIGVLLPPSYLSHLVDRWPQFFARLAVWEPGLAERIPWTWLNDHYLMIFERSCTAGG